MLPTGRIARLRTAGACCIIPGYAERDERDHAAENFFQGGISKKATPLLRQQPPSPSKIVLRQISGDGAWMKI
jgi:hypothetical protein